MSIVSIMLFLVSILLLIGCVVKLRCDVRIAEDKLSIKDREYGKLAREYDHINKLKETYLVQVNNLGIQLENQRKKLAEIDENKRFAEDQQIELQKRLDECQKLTQKKRGTRGTSPLSGVRDQVFTESGQIIEASSQLQGPSAASSGIEE